MNDKEKNKDNNPKALSEKIAGFFNRANEIGKKATSTIQENAKSFSEKSKENQRANQLKRYNPIFPEDYKSKEFALPYVVQIVDDVVRKDVEVCKGAIGWLGKEDKMQILHLYDEAIEFSGIKFIPNAECNAIYYADSCDRSRYIKIDCLFKLAHDERLAELKHIAYSLGAKKCSIEIVEGDEFSQQKSVGGNLGVAKIVGAKVQVNRKDESSQYRRGCIVAEFEGSNTPKKPTLKWFKHDDNIKNLIEMRCSKKNAIKSETLELEGATSATMSQKTAISIDAILSKLKAGGGVSVEKNVKKENHSKLIFCVEF
ncbi:MAG: hypothetical protein IJ400_05020 [Clostridia bacterium]|nr:hypothetical protein [Clostridia bacterium]